MPAASISATGHSHADASLAATAAHRDATLLTRDERAVDVYERNDAEIMRVSDRAP